jgi:hypothetical protein
MKKPTVLTVCLLLLLALSYLSIAGVRTTRIEVIQNIVSQNLKSGASSEQVMRFLDGQHLEHSRLVKPEFMRFDGHNYGNRNVIVAIKRNTRRSLLQTESIQLVFVFNDNREMLRFDVFPVYTGL